MQIWPGQPYPLGATFDGVGTNFSIFSEAAQRVELCLFDDDGKETRVDLPEITALCWHIYLPQVRPGQRYGYRVHGPWDPDQGHWCNPHKLLLDPYAKAVEGMWEWNEAVFPYHFEDPENSKNDLDSAPFCPRSVVINPYFDWGNDRRPNTPWHKTVVYETHVKGFTKTAPGHSRRPARHLRGNGASGGGQVPAAARRHGRGAAAGASVRAGLDARAEEAAQLLGLQLDRLPGAAQRIQRAANSGEQVQEFKQLVKTLHDAGIEVILDVVYNHTAEGNHLGPMLSFKGIDNAAYYRLMADNRRYYMDYTGTGNTLNMRHPHVLQLIMDSLRYWVIDMHVDGFRFDLAATLARELHDVDRLSAFFDIIQQDPVISQVKLIAEPWDVGEGGYQVGNFPPLWSEWNGKYRDSVRDFWRGTDQTLAEFAYRFTGSSDLYAGHGAPAVREHQLHHRARRLHAARPGLLQREAQRGQRRGQPRRREPQPLVELRRRGADRRSQANALRNRQVRNFLTTLMLSQGVPMLLGGDEIGRTQSGNNNAYCQDNEIIVVRLGACRRQICCSSHAASDPDAPPASGVLPPPLVPGTADSRHGGQRHRLVHAGRQRDVGRRLAGGFREIARRVPQRPRHPDAERARRAGGRRQLLRDVQRESRAGRLHAAGGEVGPAVGGAARDRRVRQKTPTRTRPAREYRSGGKVEVPAWSLVFFADRLRLTWRLGGK